jgi:hypothetical protein
MLAKLLFVVFIEVVSATTIRHNNYCKQTLDITEYIDGGSRTLLCNISYREACSKNYTSTGSKWVWFQHGRSSKYLKISNKILTFKIDLYTLIL